MCNAQARARARGSQSPDPRSARPEAQARPRPGDPRRREPPGSRAVFRVNKNTVVSPRSRESLGQGTGAVQAPTARALKVFRPAGSRGDTDLRVFGRTRHIEPLVDGDLAYAGDMLVYGTASLRLRSR